MNILYFFIHLSPMMLHKKFQVILIRNDGIFLWFFFSITFIKISYSHISYDISHTIYCNILYIISHILYFISHISYSHISYILSHILCIIFLCLIFSKLLSWILYPIFSISYLLHHILYLIFSYIISHIYYLISHILYLIFPISFIPYIISYISYIISFIIISPIIIFHILISLIS